MSRPRLSLTGITWNSGDRLEAWIAKAREYADEIALFVDESSKDNTYDVACAYADRVRLVQHPPYVEVYHDLMLRHATGEWILFLDDDEIMGPEFGESKDALLSSPELTHYYLPYRWVVPAEDGDDRYLTSFPWAPNPRLRLIRNVGSIWSHRGRLHSPLDVAGEGRFVAPEEAVIYHLDLLWRSRAEREAKVARYRGNNAPSCEEYYLYEDYADTTSSETLTPPLDQTPSPTAQRAVRIRAERGLVDPSGPRVTVDAELQRIRGFWDDAPIFGAEYPLSTTPTSVFANRGYAVDLTIRNTSPVRWRTSGPERGRVVLGYHWLSAEHGMLLRDGDLSILPAAVEPGETVHVEAGLWTPYEPGEYTLQWDLVAEQVNWFSERGVAPLEIAVKVDEGHRILATPRAVATLPPAAVKSRTTDLHGNGDASPKQARRLSRALGRTKVALQSTLVQPSSWVALTGRNVVALEPARALDTRDGTGVSGAINGPVKAGSTVTLRIAGSMGIPDYAIGVVATISVTNADYNGFVNVVPGAGPPTGVVSGYFTDQGPAAFQILSPLADGRLTVWISDNWPGTAQLLLDVTAFLTA